MPRVILIVDDDEGIGDPVATAANGREALAWLRAAAQPPTVVLLDLMMPVMDGWQVIDAIEREGLVARDRVVVITAHRDARLPEGVAAIKKPMTAATVLDAIRRRAG